MISKAVLALGIISLIMLSILVSCGRKSSSVSTGGGILEENAVQTGNSAPSIGGELASTTAPPVDMNVEIARIDQAKPPDGVNAGLFGRIKAELVRQLKETPGRTISRAPSGDSCKVTDLAWANLPNGDYELSWTYRNDGDLNQDGEVNVGDLSEIALHYGKSSTDDPAPDPDALADADGNGEVGISDISVIAANFLKQVAGYEVWAKDWSISDFQFYDVVELSTGTRSAAGTRLTQRLLGDIAYNGAYVQPKDAAGGKGMASAYLDMHTHPSREYYQDISEFEGSTLRPTPSLDTRGEGPISYRWDFGGGATPNEIDGYTVRSTVIGQAGLYDASLTVANSYGSVVSTFKLNVYADSWERTQVYKGNVSNMSGANVNGKPVVAFTDYDSKEFLFGMSPTADGSGVWAFSVVDAPTGSHGEISSGSSIAEVDGRPAVCYMRRDDWSPNAIGDRVYLIFAVSAVASSPGPWQKMVIDTDRGYSPRLAVLESGLPAICYNRNGYLYFARCSTQGGLGQWSSSMIVSPTANTYALSEFFSVPYSVGIMNGRPAVLFTAYTVENRQVTRIWLRYASSPTVDGQGLWTVTDLWDASGLYAFVRSHSTNSVIVVDGLPVVASVPDSQGAVLDLSKCDSEDGSGQWKSINYGAAFKPYTAPLDIKYIGGSIAMLLATGITENALGVAISPSGDPAGPWSVDWIILHDENLPGYAALVEVNGKIGVTYVQYVSSGNNSYLSNILLAVHK